MTYVAIVLALAALGYAFLTRRKLQELTRRHSRTSNNVYELAAHIETLEEKLDAQTQQLSFEIKKAAGQINFAPATTIGEVQAQHPFAEQILAGFHMGGCNSCAVEPHETIAEACQRLEVSEPALLAALRDGNGAAAAIPLHNIELQI